jgi:hypothetical protein
LAEALAAAEPIPAEALPDNPQPVISPEDGQRASGADAADSQPRQEITAETFTPPVLVTVENTIEHYLCHEGFSAELAREATAQLEWFRGAFDAADTDAGRDEVLRELFDNFMYWRMDLVRQGKLSYAKGSSVPPPQVVAYSAIKGGNDPVGVGWWTEEAEIDPETLQWRQGIVTPGSEQKRKLGEQAEALFAGTDADIMPRNIELPGGEIVQSGEWYRGRRHTSFSRDARGGLGVAGHDVGDTGR